MYVCQLSLLQLLIWAGYRHFKERLPEAICHRFVYRHCRSSYNSLIVTIVPVLA